MNLLSVLYGFYQKKYAILSRKQKTADPFNVSMDRTDAEEAKLRAVLNSSCYNDENRYPQLFFLRINPNIFHNTHQHLSYTH